MIRIGQGWDVHRLVEGRPLILGGVTVPHDKGQLGHSDAYALLHALTDALLGAAGLGDIGSHFPDTDPAFHGVDSRILLRETVARLARRGWKVVNVDSTVIAQRPKLASHIPAMRAHIATDLRLDMDAVNIKAKTSEKLGHLGREEGIAAQAVCLIEKA